MEPNNHQHADSTEPHGDSAPSEVIEAHGSKHEGHMSHGPLHGSQDEMPGGDMTHGGEMHGGHMEQCHFEELFRLIEEEGEKVFGETQERYADLAANDITAEAEHLLNRIKQEKEGEEEQ